MWVFKRGWLTLILLIIFFFFIGRGEFQRAILQNRAFVSFNQALAHGNPDDLSIASNQFAKALNRQPHNPNLIYGSALLKSKEGDLSEAIEAWSQVDSRDISFIEFGKKEQASSNYDEALYWYEHATQLSTYPSDGWHRIGIIHHHESLYWQPEKALEAYETALDIDLFSKDALKADTFYQKANLHERLNASEATIIADYESATVLDETHYWAFFRLGMAYDRVENTEKAIALLEKALSIWPNGREDIKLPYEKLGDFYVLAERYTEAEINYKKALSVDINNLELQGKMEILDTLQE